jgi:tetratricopeptide (TPR) repeat protein
MIEGADQRTMREYYRYRAWVHARRGDVSEAIRSLEHFGHLAGNDFPALCCRVATYRYLGLTPHPRTDALIAEGVGILEQRSHLDPATTFPFLGHAASTYLRRGNPERALELLNRILRSEHSEIIHSYTRCRVLADMADTHRMKGDLTRAWEFARESRELARHCQYHGDYADFSLTYLAKLQNEMRPALSHLNRALEVQRSLGNEMGEARSLLLLARVQPGGAEAEVARQRLTEIESRRSALQTCPLYGRIRENWEAWLVGDPDPHPGGVRDRFWCV